MICRECSRYVVAGVLGMALGHAVPAWAAPPTVAGVMPVGLQSGATTTLTITGTDLMPAPQVILPVPIAAQVVREGSTANQLLLDLTLASDVAPGIYPMRVVTTGGISATAAVGIDSLPQLPFADSIANLPVALSGTLVGTAVLRTSFEGKLGETIVVDVEGRRLGMELNPVVRLFDSRNLQLAWSQTSPAVFGDARTSVVLPSDGRYTVELHDALYRGAAPGTFRLKIGQLHYADRVFPLGVRLGTPVQVQLVSSNLPDGLLFDLPQGTHEGTFPVPLPTGAQFTGARPGVIYSEHDELVEMPPADGQLQTLAPPMAISGRLSGAGESDQYAIVATPGQTLRLDVLAGRVGSPLDGVLSVRGADGVELATSDDRPGTTDPGLDFAVPPGHEKLVVAISDLQHGGGPDHVYRLAVTPVGQPDFSLDVLADRLPLPQGGNSVVRVRANRAGYNGPIKLSVPGLAEGLLVAGAEIPAGATDTLLSLSPGDQMVPPTLASLVGESMDPAVALRRVGQVAATPLSALQPWLRGELVVAGVQRSPLAIVWGADSAAPQGLPLAARLALPVTISREMGMAGAVRLSLLTSQIIPKKTVQMNNQNQEVDDVDRALRADGTPMIAADQAAGALEVLVPADLPNIPYDLAVQAELLAADGTTVIASAVTPSRRLTTIQAFTIELAGDPRVEARSGSGETGKLAGRVVKLGGFNRPLVLTLEGLPGDLPVPELEVAGDQTDFALPVAFPYGVQLAELANVSLVALDRSNPQAVLRSNALPVTVNIVAGGPPAALYGVFEDQKFFVSLLNEGEGQVTLEATDRYSGQAALKVTPDQRFRSRLPGLGVKIAESPAEGEYRYLRFAWKKKGGGNIMLQFNANGAFGPAKPDTAPSYRYESGPADNPYNAAAIRLDQALPENWVVVTRDLFADFGAFSIDGVAFTASDGEYALFDHIYLARTEADLAGCEPVVAGQQPLAIFEDQPEFVALLDQGDGTAKVFADEKFSGSSSVKVTPGQKFNPALSGLGVKIRANPAPGEYRYLQFAWKKVGGERICLQLNHDGKWGPQPDNPGKFRYDAGPAAGESYGAALRVDPNLPAGFVLVTRDLVADFGEFTLTGIALSPQDGEYALFDHIYLGQAPRDFDLAQPQVAVPPVP